MSGKILLGCSNYWSSPIQVGDHHLARQFARDGWAVAFVSQPITPLHVLRPANADLRARWAIHRRRGIEDENASVWAYVPAGLLAPYGSGPLASSWVLRNWHRLTWPGLLRLVRSRGFGEVDLLYLRDARQAFWLDSVRYAASVYRIADNDAGFRSRTPALAAAESEIARRVDLVVYTARTLASYVERLRPRRMEYLPNGVNYAHFARDDLPVPAEYRGMARPIAVYVGSMDEWFDFELVARCARDMQDVSFVLIGPSKLAEKRLPRRDNLHLLGPRPYAQVPAYMAHAQVGVVPFAVRRFSTLVNSVNPLKIYEYLAAGIPVVASSWDELRAMDAPIRLCEDPEAFPEALRDAFSGGLDRTALRRYARTLDWPAIYSRLRRFLAPSTTAPEDPLHLET